MKIKTTYKLEHQNFVKHHTFRNGESIYVTLLDKKVRWLM